MDNSNFACKGKLQVEEFDDEKKCGRKNRVYLRLNPSTKAAEWVSVITWLVTQLKKRGKNYRDIWVQVYPERFTSSKNLAKIQHLRVSVLSILEPMA